MAVALFIDANQYLKLFGLVAGKRLLDSLDEQKDHIFVSEQIADEVCRNKLACAQRFFSANMKDPLSTPVPDHLLGISEQEASTIRAAFQHAEEAKSELKKLSGGALNRISQSTDDVSVRLGRLFDGAPKAGPEVLQRARDRKERGNPPGKEEDALGDQITWEQLLAHCSENKVERIWIITADRDYHVMHDGKALLNSFLYSELVKTCGTSVEVRCFDDLLKGITDFGKHAGVKAEKLPTEQEATVIKKEIDSLPVFITTPAGTEWLVNSGGAWYGTATTDDATMRAILNANSRRRGYATYEVFGTPLPLLASATDPSSGTVPVASTVESTKK